MSTLTPDLDTLADHFDAARDEAGDLEADRVLAGLSERLFGIKSEPLEIGRYVVLRRLGAGGMGVVYLGYDGELDRNVAIKLLRARHASGGSKDRAAARLLREARALARIKHPNVIAIHEVGTSDGAVFIAMERVQGVTLARWQEEGEHSWRELVELYVQAGRGLAAAHAAGLIHRDFKPSNVLVGDDGDGLGLRARVVDFGLARASRREEVNPSDGDGDGDGDGEHCERDRPRASASSSLTVTGALLGTPAYMAPEQIQGHVADARSDQFSFALALYEALCGERAFAGDSLDALHAAVVAGERRPTPRGRALPGWLRRVLDRALSSAPERRFASMLILLKELEAGLGERRRRGLVVGGVGLALTAALIGSAAARPERCLGGAAVIAEVWGDEQRAAIDRAFTATGKPFAAKAQEQTRRRLDAYAEGWAAMHQSACAATHIRDEQSSAGLDLRMRCLDRRRSELRALVALFTGDELDPKLVARAVEASDALTPLDGCADVEALGATDPLPDDPRERAQVDALRRRLDEIKAERDAGRYDTALLRASDAFDASEAIGYRPLRAEAALLHGSLLGLVGSADEAAIAFDSAFTDGLASGHIEVAAEAAIQATHTVGFVGHHGGEGRRWAHLAEPLVIRLGEPPRALATLKANLGTIAVLQGELDEAEEHFTRAIALTEAAFGGNETLIAKTSANLGAVYRRKGDLPRALASYRRAAAVFEANFGPRHPLMATLANNTGVLLQTMKDSAGAERSYRQVIDLGGASIATTSPTLGHANNNLGELLLERGEIEAAADHFASAIEIWEAALGENHPLLAHPLLGLGKALIADGQTEEGVELLRRALELREGAEVGATELEEVRAELERALATLEGRL